MIRLFRNYHPAVIVLLILLIGVFKIGAFFHGNPDANEFKLFPLSSVVGVIISWSPLPFVFTSFILSCLLVFIQSIVVNNIVNELRLLQQSSYIPAFAFIICSNLVPEFSIFNPQLIANTFLIFAISEVYKFYHREKIFGQIFNTGFILSGASLLYYPYFVFSLFVLAGLITMRPFSWREWVVGILGLIIPVYLTATYLFVTKQLSNWLTQFSFSMVLPVNFNSIGGLNFLIPSAIITLIMIWSILNVQQNIFKMLVQTRLCFIILIWFFFNGLLILFTGKNIEIESLSWSAIPAAIGLAYFFYEFKKQKLAEMIALSLLLTLLFFQYKSYLIS